MFNHKQTEVTVWLLFMKLLFLSLLSCCFCVHGFDNISTHNNNNNHKFGISGLASSNKNSSLMSLDNNDNDDLTEDVKSGICQIESIIGQDDGGRGMKSLIVPGDLKNGAMCLCRLKPGSTVLVLSGFPCCVTHEIPTETDGPPGAVAIARSAVALGHRVVMVTDDCNKSVFAAACRDHLWNQSNELFSLVTFPAKEKMTAVDHERMNQLAMECHLIIACERAGPAQDGNCYTMRGISMTSRGLIAPLDTIVRLARNKNKTPFVAIGDGGNEMGMGKVLDAIHSNPQIPNAQLIAAVTPADHLIAASVSNWGGYALAATVALIHTNKHSQEQKEFWVNKCLPSKEEEVSLLQRCVDAGCRDGVSGEMEATVDGMPLSKSLNCLESIRSAACTTSSTSKKN